MRNYTKIRQSMPTPWCSKLPRISSIRFAQSKHRGSPEMFIVMKESYSTLCSKEVDAIMAYFLEFALIASFDPKSVLVDVLLTIRAFEDVKLYRVLESPRRPEKERPGSCSHVQSWNGL